MDSSDAPHPLKFKFLILGVLVRWPFMLCDRLLRKFRRNGFRGLLEDLLTHSWRGTKCFQSSWRIAATLAIRLGSWVITADTHASIMR